MSSIPTTVLVREPATGRAVVGGIEIDAEPGRPSILGFSTKGRRAALIHLPSGEIIEESSTPYGTLGLGVGSVRGLSPDALHYAFISFLDKQMEIWRWKDDRRVLQTPGDHAIFSPDGLLVCVARDQIVEQRKEATTGRSAAFELTVHELASGQQL